MGKVIGIDLGTTYSCVSCVDDMGVIRIIDSAEGGGYTTPSVVYFDSDTNDVLVGEFACQEGYLHPESMVKNIKCLLGDPNYLVNINGEDYSPTAVLSLILRKLVNDAECWLGGEEIEGAIITCPAYFGAVAREAIKVAGENVTMSNGQRLNVLQILDEPVAAAIAYGDFRHEDMQKTVLIYDLGGTFDVAVMKLSFVGDSRNMEIITTYGDHQLGGEDWNHALSDYVRNKFCELTGSDSDEMLGDPAQIRWFSENIEKAKIMLTRKERVMLVPSFNGNKEKVEITREIFDTETECYLDRTIQLIDDMMNKEGLSVANDIDEIILVGGSTRMPQVERRLSMEYNKPIISYEPDKAVSMGAALVATKKSILNTNASIIDEESKTDGIHIDFNSHDFLPEFNKINKSIGAKVFIDGKWQLLNLLYRGMYLPARGVSAGDSDVDLRIGIGDGKTQLLTIELYENDSLEQLVDFGEVINYYTTHGCVRFSLDKPINKGSDVTMIISMDDNEATTLTLLVDNEDISLTAPVVWKKLGFLEPPSNAIKL